MVLRFQKLEPKDNTQCSQFCDKEVGQNHSYVGAVM